MGGIAFPNGFGVTLRPHKIRDPIKWKTPAKIFVNSMSDLFHREIPDDYLRQIWDTMLVADWHVYQVLTKRAHRMAHKIEALRLPTPAHIWLGVSAENQEMADSRIPAPTVYRQPHALGQRRAVAWPCGLPSLSWRRRPAVDRERRGVRPWISTC